MSPRLAPAQKLRAAPGGPCAGTRRNDAGARCATRRYAWMAVGRYAPTAAAETSGVSRLTLAARIALAASVSGLGGRRVGYDALSQGVGASVTHEAIEAWMGLVPGESGSR